MCLYRNFLITKLITLLLFSLLPTVTLQIIMSGVVTGAPSKNVIRSADITDVVTDIVLYERGGIIQFVISWKDNMPIGTSYNIVITAMNETECSEPPCSVYGVIKSTKQIVVPENPMAHVHQNECGFKFGCNYFVTVETSNAAISGHGTVSVPYCVMGMCSCQHASDLPEIISSVNIANNETIIFNWLMSYYLKKVNLSGYRHNITSKEWNLHVIVSELTNPLLSWGGKIIPITEHFYPIKNISYIKTQGFMQGTFNISVPKQLVAKTVLRFRSYITDDLRCEGPEHITKVTVPEFLSSQEIIRGSYSNLVIGLIIILFGIFLLATTYWSWKRDKKTGLRNAASKEETQDLSQFPSIFEMEDNLNYIDKYIEEAQAKGLADIYEIPHSKIHIGNEIGEGAFGRVYKAVALNLRRFRESTVVAVKQLKNNPTADEITEFLREIEMLKKVGTHQNIVSFLGCCTIRPPYLMLMEFVGRGDLLTYLRKVRLVTSRFNLNGTFDFTRNKHLQPERNVKYIELKLSSESLYNKSEINNQLKSSVAETTYTIIEGSDSNQPFEYVLDNKELHDFALQIAYGMRYLEAQKITHRDLAARNVLIDNNKTLKISDFGLSRHGIYINTKTRRLPLRWMSIEAIRDNVYSNKSDVWAYGVVLWEIGTLGASPYPTISNHELIPYLLSGKRLEKPEICTDQLFSIMLQCWNENEENRPTFDKLYQTLSPRAAYVDINSLGDDYVFPPI